LVVAGSVRFGCLLRSSTVTREVECAVRVFVRRFNGFNLSKETLPRICLRHSQERHQRNSTVIALLQQPPHSYVATASSQHHIIHCTMLGAVLRALLSNDHLRQLRDPALSCTTLLRPGGCRNAAPAARHRSRYMAPALCVVQLRGWVSGDRRSSSRSMGFSSHSIVFRVQVLIWCPGDIINLKASAAPAG
jgi:hypothetical protein